MRASLSLLVVLSWLPSCLAGVVHDLAVETPDVRIVGAQQLEACGSEVAAGDVDADGRIDLVISCPGRKRPGGAIGAGRVCVISAHRISGGTYDLAFAAIDHEILGAVEHDAIGDRLLVFDFDGDGIDDIVFEGDQGAVAGRPGAGAVYVVYGSPGLPADIDLAVSPPDLAIQGAAAGDGLPQFLAHGDFNGDGTEDLAASAPGADEPTGPLANAGAVYVFHGGARRTGLLDLALNTYDLCIYGYEAMFVSDGIGDALAAGDIEGDGLDELALKAAELGAPDQLVFVIRHVSRLSGAVRLDLIPDVLTFRDPAGEGFGSRIHMGDFDNDGVTDIAVAARALQDPGGTRPVAGGGYLIRGPLDRKILFDVKADTPDLVVYGATGGAQLGVGADAFDYNGDGRTDWMLETWRGRGAAELLDNAGEMHVVFGRDPLPSSIDLLAVPADVAFYGKRSGDKLTITDNPVVADLNSDGCPDVAAASLLNIENTNPMDHAGEVYIFFGSEGETCRVAAQTEDLEACAGATVTAAAILATAQGCAVGVEYRWRDAGGIVKDWSADPTLKFAPAAGGPHMLDVRCPDRRVSCESTSRFEIALTPDDLPPDQGNVLKSVKDGPTNGVHLLFAGAPASQWRVFRDAVKAAAGTTALAPDTATPDRLDAEVLTDGILYFYRIKGLSACTETAGP